MTAIRSVLWQNPYDRSSELCRLSPSADGWVIEGVVVIPAGDEPARVEYRVDADEGWNTRRARIQVRGPDWQRELELTASASGWQIDGSPAPELDGCSDVDLRVTPATNTLPIRRLALDPGGTASIRAAWVGFPDLEVVPSDQTYRRLDGDRHQFSSGDFHAELEVNDAGLVLRYGHDYWRALAAS